MYLINLILFVGQKLPYFWGAIHISKFWLFSDQQNGMCQLAKLHELEATRAQHLGS